MKQGSGFQFGLPMTQAVKVLVIAHVAIWFIGQVVLEGLFRVRWTLPLNLVPSRLLFEYALWQPFTYMFLHSTNITHILFNMLMLWLFGAEVEQKMGTKRFFWFYIINGVGAALIYCFGLAIYAAITGSQAGLFVPVVGASGALFGVMLAYGWF
ncbi:MAG: rhomboid family intramembrane serine protease, partial [Bdellovibrionota bacterium]